MKQRVVIKFHAKFSINASETFWLMQQVYGDNFLSSANIFLWHKRFLEGREGLEDDNRIRPEYRDPEIWSLLHDNAPSHTSLIVR